MKFINVLYVLLYLFFNSALADDSVNFDALFQENAKNNNQTIQTIESSSTSNEDLEKARQITDNAQMPDNFVAKLGKAMFTCPDCKSDISAAEGRCFQIKDKDGLNGCMAGIKLAQDDISAAEGRCFQIRDKDGLNGCMAGINLAKNDISAAEGRCFQIRDKDGLNGCMAGIKLAQDDISAAEGRCFQIRDQDGLNGCMAGINLAQDNVSAAEGRCFQIRDKDGLNDCMSGVTLAKYFLSQEENNGDSNDSEVTGLESEVKTIESALSADKQEAQALIKEIEANPKLLKNPETKKLYQSLKEIIN